MQPDPNLAHLERMSACLGKLTDELLLVGGSAAGLLVTDPTSSPIRPTEDIDLVVEAVSYTDYQAFCSRLGKCGLVNGQEPGDPISRWRGPSLVLDVMPTDERILGFSNRWYASALETPQLKTLPSGNSVRHIDAPHFLATKLEAYASRGNDDPLMSHDLEDLVVVVDGREGIVGEVEQAPSDLQETMRSLLGSILGKPHFLEALPGYFVGHSHQALRARSVVQKLRAMSSTSNN